VLFRRGLSSILVSYHSFLAFPFPPVHATNTPTDSSKLMQTPMIARLSYLCASPHQPSFPSPIHPSSHHACSPPSPHTRTETNTGSFSRVSSLSKIPRHPTTFMIRKRDLVSSHQTRAVHPASLNSATAHRPPTSQSSSSAPTRPVHNPHHLHLVLPPWLARAQLEEQPPQRAQVLFVWNRICGGAEAPQVGPALALELVRGFIRARDLMRSLSLPR
jgi:hypothetical protein